MFVSNYGRKNFVDDHRQKNVEITKDCLWNELQNYFVESTEKKLVCLQFDCKHLQCTARGRSKVFTEKLILSNSTPVFTSIGVGVT